MSQALKAHVKGMRDRFNQDFTNLDELILKKDLSQIPIINTISNYIVSAGGKRIRPLMNILIARALGYKGFDHIRLSACIEFIHTATLLHDDIVDNSEKRRGRYTSHHIWNNSASILTGDFLFTKAFEIMTEIGDVEVLKVLSSASSQIVEGEMMQLVNKGNLEITLEDCIEITKNKTAVLFAAATKTGAMVATSDTQIHQNANDIGLNFGVLFQIIDDILDYLIENPNLDKNTGDDFAEGKLTLPIVFLLNKANEDEKEKVANYLTLAHEGNLENPKEALKYTYTLLVKYNCLEESKTLAKNYANKTKAIIESTLPESFAKQDLIKLIDLNLERLV